MPRSTKWTKRKQAVLLDVLRSTGNVSAGIRAAGVSRTQAYCRRKTDPAFRAEWDSALEGALDDLEGALRRRAVDGVEKAVFYGGKQCGSSVSYSDNLGMFLLRGRRKDVFGEGRSASTAGPEFESDPADASPRERLLTKLSEMSAAGQGGVQDDRRETGPDRPAGDDS